MDPASAIGVAGVAFQLFAYCAQGFLILSSALNLGKDASTLRCMLNLEEYRFHQWGEKSGLLGDYPKLERCELNERLNRKLIEETLGELRGLLTDTKKLKERYNLELSTEKPQKAGNNINCDDFGSELGNESTERGGKMLEQVVCHKKRGMILLKAKLVHSASDLPKRLWWAVADKSGFESLVRQIGFFVQRLIDLLDEQEKLVMRNSIRQLLLNMVALHDKLDELKAIQTSVEFVVGEDSPIASSAAVKHLRMELQQDSQFPMNKQPNSQLPPPPPYPSSALRNEYGRPKSPLPRAKSPNERTRRPPLPTIDPSLITRKNGKGPLPPRETAIYDQTQPIYIEWKAINRALRSKIRHRVENLAHLLHAPKHDSFRALHCKGFFEDYAKCQYGFAFDRPAHCEPTMPPLSLLQLFRMKGFFPSQTERLGLARILATALLQLHSAGWLHKSLRSDNILFFPHTIHPSDHEKKSRLSLSGKQLPLVTPENICLSQPYLVGYEYARFDSTSEVSEQPSSNPEHDIYRHPLAVGADTSESFNRLFDIYAFGLILLEIALWRPLKKIVSKMVPELSSNPNSGSVGPNGKKSSNTNLVIITGDAPQPIVKLSQIIKIKEYLLDHTTEENIPRNLAFLMGDIYTAVVLRCLRGDFNPSGATEDGYEEVEGIDLEFDESLGSGSHQGAKVSEGFLRLVVEELERCVL